MRTITTPTLALFAAIVLIGSLPLHAQSLVGIPHGPNDPGDCDYNDPSGCEDKAVFNTSSFDTWFGRWIFYSAQNKRILLNVEYDSDGNGTLDSWRYNPSKVVVDMPDPFSTVALGAVFATNVPTYYNPANGQLYLRIMYFVYQGNPAGNPPDTYAGHVCISYSNDISGPTWTTPIAAVFNDTGSPRGMPCTVSNAEVPVEAISGFTLGNDIHLFALHGDISILLAAVTSNPNGGLTETYYLKTTPGAPDVIDVQAMITSNGMFTPTISGGDHDYFFRNLDATYDPVSGRVYILRATPYPWDISRTDIPCEGVCPHGLPLFTLRGQIYSMNVGTNIGMTTSPAASWTLLDDVGTSKGWAYFNPLAGCTLLPTSQPQQQNIGLDLDSISIHKTASGQIALSGGAGHFFLGAWAEPLDRKYICDYVGKIGGMRGGIWRDAELWEMNLSIP